MKQELTRRVVVLGAGPAGTIAALELSKTFNTTLVVQTPPFQQQCHRVDSVPAALLALLIDFGIHPREFGVDVLYSSQLRAWVDHAIQENPIPASAHVERPLLEQALLRRVRASSNITILPFDRDLLNHYRLEEQHQRIFLLDATGRRSISAERIVRPANPWVARSFVVCGRTRSADPAMRIASLPSGYLYRLGSSQHFALTVVGRGDLVSGTPRKIERYIIGNGAGWILEGLPALSEMSTGKASTAAIQWSIGGSGYRIGDAAIARDTLSGQGVALGITDALCAASSLREHGNCDLLLQRQEEQRRAHLSSLGTALRSSRFSSELAWRCYCEFLERQSPGPGSLAKVSLLNGSLRIQTA